MKASAADRLLTALQLGDSFFPSGATSQSWGLEELRKDKRITDGPALETFMTGQPSTVLGPSRGERGIEATEPLGLRSA